MSSSIKQVYLLLGPELGDKGQRIKEIRSILREEQGTDPEIHRFYPFETENGEIFTALSNNSLFADHRLVILSQAESLNTSQVNLLAEYIAKPSESATLLIVSTETSLPAKLSAKLDKDQVQVFWEMFDNRKADWVRTLFQRSSITIENEAVELLLELVENNTQELKATCAQLIQFITSDPGRISQTVSENDVESYIQHTRQESVFSLFEDIITKPLEKALGTLQALIRSGDGESVPLLAGLLWQFRRLVSYLELIEQGATSDEACKQVKVMGKSAAIRRKKDQTNYALAAQRYSLAEARSIIARLGEYDIRTREMGTDFQPMLLEQFLYVVMEKKGEAPCRFNPVSFATDAKF
jgi:DNA polymerase-3 subunit delta